jgi:hypothetical protein
MIEVLRPEDAYHVGEDGARLPDEAKKEWASAADYWANKKRLLSAIVLVSFLFFGLTLLAETDVLQAWWSGAVNAVGGYLGQFVPKLG